MGPQGETGEQGKRGSSYNDETRYLLRVQYNLYRSPVAKPVLFRKVGVFTEYDFRHGNLDEIGISVELGK